MTHPSTNGQHDQALIGRVALDLSAAYASLQSCLGLVSVCGGVGVGNFLADAAAAGDFEAIFLSPGSDSGEVAGFDQFRMQAANASAAHDGLPAVYAAVADGRFWSSGSSMTQDLADDGLVLAAAESVTDTLIECERVSWPTCVLHSGPPMILKEDADSSAPAWWCASGQHRAASLGLLFAATVAQ